MTQTPATHGRYRLVAARPTSRRAEPAVYARHVRLLGLLLLVGSSSPWAAAARSVPWQVYAPRDSAGLRLEGIDSLPCQPGARLLTAT
ncbi:MAG: hypothetical protein ACXVZP_10165, partial [Gaiellaceae bacterium]